tara:strand:+ start:561 stop:884 length:324 start_codon:yes stop_codon:yes gene_type:complete
MEQPTVTKAIKALAPNAEFSYDTDGDGNWTITNWYSDDIDQPSNSDIEAKLTELQTDYNNKQYQRDRAVAYASIQDQLDMQYWDNVNSTTTWKDHIAKVKSDNPKPE